MHAEARDFVARVLGELPARRTVIEFGARNVNGAVRDLLGDAVYLGVDRLPGIGVDVVCDAADFNVRGHIDTVLCLEVLEHAANAAALVANAGRILEPGGVFIATMATDPRAPHSALDGGRLASSEFYHNVTLGELADWVTAAGLRAGTYECHSDRGDLYVWAVKED